MPEKTMGLRLLIAVPIDEKSHRTVAFLLLTLLS